MMQQWSLQKETLAAPDIIILGTQRMVEQFRRRIRMLTYEQLRNDLLEKEAVVLESLIQALQYDNKVQTEIMCGTMDVIRHDFDIQDREDIGLVASALIELAEGLYLELQRVGAYQNGYLYYQYHSFEDRDLVMARLTLPEISAKGNYGRQRR